MLNNCVFYGEIVELSPQGDSFVELKLKVATKRKLKTKKTVVEENVLNFEIWDSAAKFILQFYNIGDKLLVKATAKSRDKYTFFRIDEFFSV